MRTTVRLDEEWLREAKRAALESNRTLTAVIEDALRESLSRRQESPAPRPIKLPAFGSGGLMPGVDIDNSAALLDVRE